MLSAGRNTANERLASSRGEGNHPCKLSSNNNDKRLNQQIQLLLQFEPYHEIRGPLVLYRSPECIEYAE